MQLYKRTQAIPARILQALTQKLAQKEPRLSKIEANLWMFLRFEDASGVNKRLLESFLCAQEVEQIADHWDQHKDILVLPRKGTKAQAAMIFESTAKHVGLLGVEHVTIGVHYRFHLAAVPRVDADTKRMLFRHIHDQSQQQCCTDWHELLDQMRYEQERQSSIEADIDDMQDASILSITTALGLALNADQCHKLTQLFSEKYQRNPHDMEILTIDGFVKMHSRSNTELTILQALKQHQNTNVRFVQDKKRGLYEHRLEHAQEILRKDLSTGLYVQKKLPLKKVVSSRVYHGYSICPYHIGKKAAGHTLSKVIAASKGGVACEHGMMIITTGWIDCPVKKSWLAKPAASKQVASAWQTITDANKAHAYITRSAGIPLLTGGYRMFCHRLDKTRVLGASVPVIYNTSSAILKQSGSDDLLPGYEILLVGAACAATGETAERWLGVSQQPSMDHQHHPGIDHIQTYNMDAYTRVQALITECSELADNPIAMINEVGAGGIARACLQILDRSTKSDIGIYLQLRKIPTIYDNFAPMVIWGSETQGRFLLLCAPENLAKMLDHIDRNACHYSRIGQISAQPKLQVYDEEYQQYCVDINRKDLEQMVVEPEIKKEQKSFKLTSKDAPTNDSDRAAARVLQIPGLSDNSAFLREYDCHIGGLVVRNHWIGEWQVPVGKIGVVRHDFMHYSGNASSLCERTPQAYIDPEKSAINTVAESILRLGSVAVEHTKVVLDLCWVFNSTELGMQSLLKKSIQTCLDAINKHINCAVNIQYSDQSWHTEQNHEHSIGMPTLIAKAYTEVADVRQIWPGGLKQEPQSVLVWVNLSTSMPLGGSAYNQAHSLIGEQVPAVSLSRVVGCMQALQALRHEKIEVLSYNACGAGGLWMALCELGLAGKCGFEIDLPSPGDAVANLFAEGVGLVIQLKQTEFSAVMKIFTQYKLQSCVHNIGAVDVSGKVRVRAGADVLINKSIAQITSLWEHDTQAIEQYLRMRSKKMPSKQAHIRFEERLSFEDYFPNHAHAKQQRKPKLGLLVEPGMTDIDSLAAACYAVGFQVVVCSIEDMLNQHCKLAEFVGLVIPGGAINQDVPRPARIQAMQIIKNPKLKKMFHEFMHDPTTFTLGIHNGAQLLVELKGLIPGTAHWPRWGRNYYGLQNRWVMVKVSTPHPEGLFAGMEGSHLPLCISHAHGRCFWPNPGNQRNHITPQAKQNITLQYIDAQSHQAEQYPYNPDGSELAVAGFCNEDGRIHAMIGHPERGFQAIQMPIKTRHSEHGPWLRLFANARQWVEQHPQKPIRF